MASRKDSVRALQGELAWSMVTHVEAELAQAKVQLSGVQKKMNKCNDLVAAEEEQENALRNEKDEVEKVTMFFSPVTVQRCATWFFFQSIQELAATTGALEDEAKRLDAAYAKCREGGRHANKKIRESKAFLDAKRRDMETLQVSVVEL